MNINIPLSTLDMMSLDGHSKPVKLDLSNVDITEQHVVDELRYLALNHPVLHVKGLAWVPDDFLELCNIFFPDNTSFVTGEHPTVDGIPSIYHPVEFSRREKLLPHHENTFNLTFPSIVAFGSLHPAVQGGQTTVLDSRLVLKNMPRKIIEKFEKHGILYNRLCDGKTSRSWEDIYRTNSWDTAKSLAHKNQEILRNTENGVEISSLRPAISRASGEKVWINQLLHWHPAALPSDVYELVRSGFIPQHRNCQFGNGEIIEDDVVYALIDLCKRLEYPVTWSAGDILFIDNRTFQHGRLPYEGERIHVAHFMGLNSLLDGANKE